MTAIDNYQLLLEATRKLVQAKHQITPEVHEELAVIFVPGAAPPPDEWIPALALDAAQIVQNLLPLPGEIKTLQGDALGSLEPYMSAMVLEHRLHGPPEWRIEQAR